MTVAAPEFTKDWSGAREWWGDLLADEAGKPGLRYLEIGCFEGAATVWLLENVLTHRTSGITVVDTFLGSPEIAPVFDLRGRFGNNVAAFAGKVTIRAGRSDDVLRTLDPGFDFVYVDGSHRARDVLADAVLAWPLLTPGGLLVFDDYAWGPPDGDAYDRPGTAVDAFVTCFAAELEVVAAGYQYAVRKHDG